MSDIETGMKLQQMLDRLQDLERQILRQNLAIRHLLALSSEKTGLQTDLEYQGIRKEDALAWFTGQPSQQSC